MTLRTLALAFALPVAVAGGVVATVAHPRPALAGQPLNQRATPFTLPTLDGGQVSLAALAGKVVLVDFWASWCDPCRQELPLLDKLQRELAGQDFVVVAVNLDENRDNAKRLVQQLKLASVKVALDPAGSVAAKWDPPKMPTSFLVDKSGVVRAIHAGFDGPRDIDTLKREIAGLAK